LAFLIQHACVQHILESPIWVQDLDVLIRSETIDWPTFLAWRARLGIRTASAFALEMAQGLFSTPIPDEVRTELARGVPSTLPPLARRRREIAADPLSWFLTHPRSLAWVAFHRLLLRDSLWSALREYGWSRRRGGEREPLPL
jgi:hypothetical protein